MTSAEGIGAPPASVARYLLLRALKEALIALLPARRRLAGRLRVQRRIGIYERELDIVGRLTPPDRTAVDIGANAGLYAYEMARHYASVVAIEPNLRLTSDLKAARFSNVRIIHAALSDYVGQGTLSIPLAAGIVPVYALARLGGTASNSRHQSQKVPVTTLDALDLNNVGLIKIDVEGSELAVLSGATVTLERDRPVILVETSNTSAQTVRALLQERDYTEATTLDLFGVPGSPDNLLFLPTGYRLPECDILKAR